MTRSSFSSAPVRGLLALPRHVSLLALLVGLLGGLFLTSPLVAQSTGEVFGQVQRTDGSPAAGVEVRIVDLRRTTKTDAEGAFRFSALPVGDYLIEAMSSTWGGAVDRVTIAAGASTEATLRLDLTVHRDEIVVTASPDLRSQNELVQATSVLDADDLSRSLRSTLGDTLAELPGVSSSSWGGGASRPVIRGLGGDRIRVLDAGVGTGDASTTSPDHAVSLEPALAERIEVVRGPATLLYGSSATGGVVNVLGGRIPSELPGKALSGTVDLRTGSAAEEKSGTAGFSGAFGRIAWHVEGAKRETEDYESPEGTVANSFSEADSAALGLSYIGDHGYLGLSTSRFETQYGSPIEEEVSIDLEQKRFDLQGEWNRPSGFLKAIKVRAGSGDYEHVELEGDEIGTLFLNDGWEARVEAVQRARGPLTGSFGVQVLRRDFEAIGEEAFVPPTRTDSWAAFTFQEITTGALRWQLGARYESQEVEADIEEGRAARDENGLSGSLGAIWAPNDDWSLGLALSRSIKLPNSEELFSNGPHLATGNFEIGNPNLDRETNLGIDLTLRKRTGRFTGEVSLFRNRFDNFIFENFTGEILEPEEGEEEGEGLRVLEFAQRDAEFTGAEFSGVVELFHGEPHHWDAEFGADFVRAEFTDGNGDLPRIPPARYRLALHYRGDRLQGRIEGQRVEKQDRIGTLETPTDGYSLLNADVSYRLFVGAAIVDFLVRGSNLTDELARNHVSFIKDVAPLAGRDITLGLRLSF